MIAMTTSSSIRVKPFFFIWAFSGNGKLKEPSGNWTRLTARLLSRRVALV
jgi:hypothetical protein